MTTLQRLGMRAPMILPGAGWFETLKDHPKDVVVDSPLKAHFATFADTNGNFQHDPSEQPRPYELSVAVTKGQGRIVAVADSDCVSDAVIRFGGNGLFFVDSVRWLTGDEAYSGAISSEADVPITHTRKQDVVWFYASIFVAPVLVIGLGLLVTRPTRRKKRRAAIPTLPQSDDHKMQGAAS